jgi:hypothetical protein
VTIHELICDQGGAAQHGILFNSGHYLVMNEVVIRNGGGNTCGLLLRSNSETVLDVRDSTISGFAGVGGSAVCLLPGVDGRALGYLNGRIVSLGSSNTVANNSVDGTFTSTEGTQ